jgi:hypothetical protein
MQQYLLKWLIRHSHYRKPLWVLCFLAYFKNKKASGLYAAQML